MNETKHTPEPKPSAGIADTAALVRDAAIALARHDELRKELASLRAAKAELLEALSPIAEWGEISSNVIARARDAYAKHGGAA